MASSERDALICIWLFFTMIVVGLYGTVMYVKTQDISRLYVKTTCHVINRTCAAHEYLSYMKTETGLHICRRKGSCWNEYLSVVYFISNGTEITTETLGQIYGQSCNDDMNIGNNYTCFYHTSKIDSVIPNLPSGHGYLATFCIAFGIIGFMLICSFLEILVHLIDKKNKNSYHPARQDW
ncbi:hypothetical protein I4U23_019836 [Adineta vaga]|nr:hypothetical protein I4U23_019836 [Adineta vaga]